MSGYYNCYNLLKIEEEGVDVKEVEWGEGK
jgi:hypothetical protein